MHRTCDLQINGTLKSPNGICNAGELAECTLHAPARFRRICRPAPAPTKLELRAFPRAWGTWERVAQGLPRYGESLRSHLRHGAEPIKTEKP